MLYSRVRSKEKKCFFPKAEFQKSGSAYSCGIMLDLGLPLFRQYARTRSVHNSGVMLDQPTIVAL